MPRTPYALPALLLFPVALTAQSWNSPRATELVQRTIDRRTGQISANTVASYRAEATGYLTFLAQIGDTAWISPKVVKQTQLAVDVYWQAPAMSKQIVKGMRDTLLLPGDIGYYSDRFGIVQSNFPDRIRLGDGRDVSDVLHPMSAGALGAYDYAVVDSLSIETITERIDVFKVAFRPRDANQPRVVGAAYVDVRNADIVRLELGFTRAAILDDRIEHLAVVLENARVEGAWLPRRQTLEVVRTPADFIIDVRGIIRGRWDVCCYDITFAPPPAVFRGAPISFAPPEQLRAYKFEGNILDALPPDVAVVKPDDVTRAQEMAEDLVSRRFRERAQHATLAMPSISDIVRITRAEGVAIGGAGALRSGPAAKLSLDARVRYGFADEEWKGEIGIEKGFDQGRSIRFFALRDYVDARVAPEASSVRNSIAAQEFGSDYTDPYDLRAAGAQITLGRWAGIRWRIHAAAEEHDSVSVRAAPENGVYEPTIPARAIEGTRAGIQLDGARRGMLGGTLRAALTLEYLDHDVHAGRASLDIEYDRAIGATALSMRTIAAGLTNGDVAPQFGVYFGGPVTAPGYHAAEFGARRGVAQRTEWRLPAPFIPIPLGRFGSVPARATLAPFAHAVWVDDALTIDGAPGAYVRARRQGWYPAFGIALEPLLGIIRLDVARGTRDGRWTFSADIARFYWSIM
ncbi:MAG TPA: hypothetical protein VJR92_09530 [Gemmatimonadaceae bacterium]|nr:hypothetical protein [Gemmatimonadaceae bacterium]